MTMATLDDFRIWSKNLYGFFRGTDHRDYMSDTANVSAEKINADGADFLNDKSRLREKIPVSWLIEDYALVGSGNVLFYNDTKFSSFYDKPCVVKSVKESNGNGIKFINKFKEKDFEEVINTSQSENFLISQWVKPHDYAVEIWRNSGNSLRFLAYSPKGQPSRITACVHKWGTKHSGYMDNWNRGGLTTSVINGVLLDTMEDFTTLDQRDGKGSSRKPKYPEVMNRVSFHLESGSKIMGKKIPFWSESVEMVLNASEILRDELPYIGWDVIITNDGPKIIEGNPWPGIQLIQVHYPLFADLQFRDFMLDYGVDGI